MANKTRFQIAKKDIVAFFNQQQQRLYRERELEQLLAQKREGWRLAAGTRVRDFLDLMLASTPLRPVVIQVDGQPKTYYSWGDVTAFEVGNHLVPRAYLSHYTALYLHGLTEQIPKQIFVNQEQSAKPPVTLPALTQADLTAAYARPTKLTSPSAHYGDYAFVQLHSKHTGQLGVVRQDHFAAGRVALTGLERTLLDVTVRPEYAGGVYQVQEAYRLAAGRVSINRLLGLLTKLNYRYPYHQAVGLYLERAGNYKASQLQLVRKFQPITLDFYLAHDLVNPAYDAQWQVYHPAHF
ncbi:hypothetical protein [Hymenobacter sp. B81]|uniref:hypothetical protein n=1 Tax=Hymenobacter sp. B81 TaxID=3344878 RepID=UPI0037DD3C55